MIGNINGYITKEEWFLGRGGFGSVYKAEKDGNFYAVKIIQTEFLKTDYDKARLQREVDALKKINHDRIVRYYEHGVYEDKGFEYFYIVMDYVEGTNLKEVIGIVDETNAVPITEGILDALEYMHSEGIIHRDLKPENIILDKEGKPVILDFGLAKLVDYTSITPSESTLGTYCYMSPEQIKDSKDVDNRSDYFSIGVTLYELITGILPYDATNLPELIKQITERHPTPPSEINPSISNGFEDFILTLLEKESHQRYQNAAEIRVAITEDKREEKSFLDMSSRYMFNILNTEKEIVSRGIKDNLVENVIFSANLLKQYHPTAKILSEAPIRFISDPATNRLPYTVFSETTGVRELPYAPVDETTPLQVKDLQSISEVKDFVKSVIEHQNEYGVSEFVAPFFYAVNPDDEWSSINIQLLKESIRYRDENYPKVPLWGGVCIGVEDLYKDEIANKILNRYVRVAPDGFLVYGDSIGAGSSNIVQLTHYSRLLLKLQDSAKVPVVAARTGTFGLILMCLGLSGASSGLAALESFGQNLLSESKGDYGIDPRYYVPSLLSFISLPKGVTLKLKDVYGSSIKEILNCGCSSCVNLSELSSLSNKQVKLHFLEKRKEELDAIKDLTIEERIVYMKDRIDEAIKNQKILKREGIKVVNTVESLGAWKTVLEKALL